MFSVAQWKNVLYFGVKSNRRYRRLTEILCACTLCIDLKFTLSLYMYSICPQCLSPRMHQTSNNSIMRMVTEAYEPH